MFSSKCAPALTSVVFLSVISVIVCYLKAPSNTMKSSGNKQFPSLKLLVPNIVRGYIILVHPFLGKSIVLLCGVSVLLAC